MALLSKGSVSWRARTIMAIGSAAIVAGIFVAIAPAALADAGNPILNTIKSSYRVNGDNTVDVFVRGQWNWISHTSDCNYNRAATGAGIIWNDPTEPGYGVGTYSASIVASPNGASETGNVVTLTTTAPHSFVVGDTVTVSGVKVAGYNGTFTVTAVPSSTTLQYTDSHTGLANSGGGTITRSYFALVGIKTLRTGDTVNTIDEMVHPVDRGDIVEGYAPSTNNYASTTQGYTQNNLVDGVPAGTSALPTPRRRTGPTPLLPTRTASPPGRAGAAASSSPPHPPSTRPEGARWGRPRGSPAAPGTPPARGTPGALGDTSRP